MFQTTPHTSWISWHYSWLRRANSSFLEVVLVVRVDFLVGLGIEDSVESHTGRSFGALSGRLGGVSVGVGVLNLFDYNQLDWRPSLNTPCASLWPHVQATSAPP